MAVLVVLGTVSGVAVAAGTTDIVVSAQNDTLAPGETTKVTVAISDADGGVGSADLRVELTDPSVATVQDVVVEPETSSAFRNVDIDADGAGANVNFAASTTEQDTGEVALLTVTVEAAAAGATDIEVVDNPQDVVNGVAVGDEAGASYTIDSVGSTTLTVEDPNTQPTADAGDDQTVEEGAGVTLDGTGSSDPDGDTLTYAWTQTGGPDVSLSDTSVAEPTFTAPEVDTDTTLTFDLEVTDPDGASDTDTVEVTVQEVAPANFQVSNLDAPDTATQGDLIGVSADVTNSGDEEATKAVEFRVDTDGDGEIGDEAAFATQNVQLAPGETQTVTFSDVDTATLSPGTYTHGVATTDDSATAEITIEAPPTPANFQVSNLDAPSSVTAGDPIDVSATVKNTGEQAGTQTVEFRLDGDQDGTLDAGETLATQSVSLDAGETQTVTFSDLDTSGLSGEYAHGVFTDDDSATATLTVEEPTPADEVSVSLEPSESTVGVGGETTLDVVVSGLDGDGVGAFNVTVTSADVDTASITDASIVAANGGGSTEVTLAGDGSSVQLRAFARDTADSGAVTVATVTVSGVDAGTTDLGLSAEALGDEAGENYEIASTTGATVEVQPTTVSVSNLDAPDAAAPGDTIDVSATVTNEGSQTVERTVEFRLDLNGDGELTPDETVATDTVTVGAGLSATVDFAPTVPDGIALGEYEHGVFADTNQTATIRIAPPKLNPLFAGQPIDTDGDGTYEDVNGDGQVDEVDSQALFANLDNPIVSEYEAQFDYNGNGDFDVVDVQYHFFNEVGDSGGTAESQNGLTTLVGIVVNAFGGWL
jgi:hypothetical protein